MHILNFWMFFQLACLGTYWLHLLSFFYTFHFWDVLELSVLLQQRTEMYFWSCISLASEEFGCTTFSKYQTTCHQNTIYRKYEGTFSTLFLSSFSAAMLLCQTSFSVLHFLQDTGHYYLELPAAWWNPELVYLLQKQWILPLLQEWEDWKFQPRTWRGIDLDSIVSRPNEVCLHILHCLQ